MRSVRMLSSASKLHLPPSERVASNLIYWKPHKTGSTSLRSWLITVADTLQLPLHKTDHYPNSDISDHYDRLRSLNTHKDGRCSIFAGHVRVPEVSSRVDERDERSLGAVVTTTRNALNTLASKYFHRTGRDLSRPDLEWFKKTKSQQSRLWFFHWNDHDPCEVLRYYDGLNGCDLEQKSLEQRTLGIAKRIDCVVDTDDPDEDLWALCRVMGIEDREKCPEYPNRRAKDYRTLYDDLFAIPHIREVVKSSLRVTETLRDQFLKRRCRFLQLGDVGEGTLKEDVKLGAPPRWPYHGCEVGKPAKKGKGRKRKKNKSA